ncbi:MAG: hypothetical protein SGI98_09160 [Verrucomicrobiota bacterium]|nr:hypothetical protein [Verrucomicrobiota bacterium]
MSTYSDLIAKANESGQSYLLIEGNAVNFFAYPRSTMDIDFIDILGIMKTSSISLENADLKAIFIRYGEIALDEKISNSL